MRLEFFRSEFVVFDSLLMTPNSEQK